MYTNVSIYGQIAHTPCCESCMNLAGSMFPFGNEWQRRRIRFASTCPCPWSPPFVADNAQYIRQFLRRCKQSQGQLRGTGSWLLTLTVTVTVTSDRLFNNAFPIHSFAILSWFWVQSTKTTTTIIIICICSLCCAVINKILQYSIVVVLSCWAIRSKALS